MTAAMKFDHQASLAAVARRAFGGSIDVRSLLPKFEAEIGKMMAESVPKNMRARVSNIGVEGEKNRDARLKKLKEVEVLMNAGLTPDQIAVVRKVNRDTALAWVRQVRAWQEAPQ